MPIIETQRDDIKALRGVHLFHFAVSNCSQRVRLTLEEKEISWVSHHVNLVKDEHINADFRALNPNGVVPVLVHDGVTVLESNDIIQYLDEQFDGIRLTPQLPEDKAFLKETIDRSSGIQPTIKLLSHEFLFKPARRMNAKQLRDFAANCGDPQLVEFMRIFSSKEGFGDERISRSLNELVETFDHLERRLLSNPWLTGQQCGLADISWIVNVHRLAHMNYQFERHPRLQDWLDNMRNRASFAKAIAGYESKTTVAAFKIYSAWRSFRNTGIRDVSVYRGPISRNLTP